MLRFLLIFILLLGSVWLGAKLQHDPGYIIISTHHWTLETTLWIALPSLIVAFLFVHLSLLLWHKLISLPSKWHQWRSMKRIQKAQAKTRQGLIEFSEGHWQSAKNHLIKALPDADTPLLNYLTAARAAQELGDNTLRDDYLREAQQSMPEAKIAVELTQAQLQIAHQQWEQALATLRHLQDLTPHHPYVLKLLTQLYEEIGDWQQLMGLLPTLKSQQVLPEHVFGRLQQRVYLNVLAELIKQKSFQAIDVFVQKWPKNLRFDPELNATYCRYLIQQQKFSHAEAYLRRCLQKKLHPTLLDLYGQLPIEDAQPRFVEGLLMKYPHSSALLLCLARISKIQQLWGKARHYYETVLKIEATPIVYLEFAELLEQLNETKEACKAYRDGLLCSAQGER